MRWCMRGKRSLQRYVKQIVTATGRPDACSFKLRRPPGRSDVSSLFNVTASGRSDALLTKVAPRIGLPGKVPGLNLGALWPGAEGGEALAAVWKCLAG